MREKDLVHSSNVPKQPKLYQAKARSLELNPGLRLDTWAITCCLAGALAGSGIRSEDGEFIPGTAM